MPVWLDAGLADWVQGDLWRGNTIWNGDFCRGMIDWDAAGAGSPGIDLGTLRSDVAVFFGSSPLAATGLPAATRCWPDGSKPPAGQPSTWRTGTRQQPCARSATWATARR